MKAKSPKKKQLNKIEYREGSENIFAHIGIPNPEVALAKAKIAMKIHDIIKNKKLTQVKAAKILKIRQPKVSLLLRGYLKKFSLERLLRFLNDLGQNVYITIMPDSRGHGNTWFGDSLAKAIPSSIENFISDKASAPGLQQAEPMSKQPMCKHMGDPDSCKDGDAGAVKSEVFNRTGYSIAILER